MLRPRLIPALLLRDESLVKTRGFGRFCYVGDPANTVRIFNELEVDELMFLDITASLKSRGPNLAVLSNIADECFMPLGYGGGIDSLDKAKRVFDIGFEKVVVNTAALNNPDLICDIAKLYGSQAVVVSIDVKKNWFGSRTVRSHSGRRDTRRDPLLWAVEAAKAGAGEILLTSIDREGSWTGFDIELVTNVTDSVDIPVIAHGGCGSLRDIQAVIKSAGASAAAVGSFVVFQQKDMGVLVNRPWAPNWSLPED